MAFIYCQPLSPTTKKIDEGIQPFTEADGEMKFTQYQELQDLGKAYVEEILQKYGAKAAERAQAYVDGKKIDDFFNAAQMLNKLDIDTIHENSDTALNRAIEAGDFGIYEKWLGTVEDPLRRSQLRPAAEKEFKYGTTLKSAQRTFDTQGLSAAQQFINGTAYTDRQKEDLKASVAGYARQQVGTAESDAANTFDRTMKSTGGNIGASVKAAKAAAARVSGSQEAKRAADADISKAQSAALADDFNKSFVAHQENAAWLKQEAERLKAMKGGGDYEGQSGLWRSHISQLESAADSLDAAKAARETAEAKAAEKAAASASVMSDDVISAWFQGQMPAVSMNSLSDAVLTSENIGDKHVRLEDIHRRVEQVAGKEAPHIASLLGASERWMAAKFPKFSKKDYSPTPVETEEYQQAARWTFATEMEIIGNAPFSALNTDSGTLLNKLNAALFSKDLGKIDPANMIKTIQALESGALDEEVSLDPKAAPGTTEYIYPNAETKEKYTRFGQNVANMLQSAGAVPNASDVEMRHFPEKDGAGRSFGAAGDVYFTDRKTGTKYRATAKGKNIVLQRMEAGQDVLTGNWTDIPVREQPQKTGFWEGVKEFFSLPAEPRR
jgi:hypothetical protein